MQEPLRGFVVLFCYLTGIHSSEMSFFDNALAGNHRVIHIDRLTEDNRGHGIVHAGEPNTIEIDGAEVRTLATFQTTNTRLGGLLPTKERERKPEKYGLVCPE